MLLGSNSRDRYSKEFAAVDLEIYIQKFYRPLCPPLAHSARYAPF